MAGEGVTNLTSLTLSENLVVGGTFTIAGAIALLGAFTIGEDGDGDDVIFYGDTSGTYFHWDADTDSLLIPGTEGRLKIGTLSSTTQVGVTLSSASPHVIDSFADDGNAALTNAVYSNIRARTMLFKSPDEGSLYSVLGQIKCADEVDFNPGVFSGVRGYLETMDDTDVKSGAKVWGVDACLDATLASATVKDGGIMGGLHAELTGAGTFTQDSGGILAGLYVDETVTTGQWGYGAYIADGGAAVGIRLGSGTTGISFGGDLTTGIDMTSSLSATDAILIAGANADAIHISGANTAAALHVSGDQAIFALFDVDADATDGLKIAVDDSMTVTTGINICRSGTTGIATTGISIDTDGTTALSVGSGFTGVDMIVLNGTASGYGIEISGTCSTADIVLQNGATIDNDAAGSLTITEDSITLVAEESAKLVFGGETDWGVGATGTLIDGTGWDWVSQTDRKSVV